MPLYRLTDIGEDDSEKMYAWAEEHGVVWSGYNNTRGFVIMAPGEAAARAAASHRPPSSPEPWWLDPEATRCVEIKDTGEVQIILSNEPTG